MRYPILAMMTLLFAAGCAMNPVSNTPDFVLMTETQETESGGAYDVAIRKHFGIYDDKELQTYVDSIGQRLAKVSHRPDIKWQFVVIDSPDVNAFALPGGYVYITRGIMAYLNSEAELAAVLGHEIGHVTARHGVRAHSKALFARVVASSAVKGSPLLDNAIGRSAMLGGAGAFLASYSRDYELQADGLGAEYLAKAGYDPKAMLRVLGVLKEQELFERDRAKAEGREPRIYHGVFSTHPKADDRLQEVVDGARDQHATQKPTESADHDGYLAKIDGMTFGDAEDEGVLRGRVFYHKELAFSLTFPEGWRIENTHQALVAFSPDSKATLVFTGRTIDKPESAKERLRAELDTKDLRGQRPVKLPDGEGYTAVTRAKTPHGYADIRAVAVVLGTKAYMFRGFTKPDVDREMYDPLFIATAANIRKLTPREERFAEPLRLRIRPAMLGETFPRLAARSPLTSYPEHVLRLINARYPNGEPTFGEKLKIVE